MWERLENLKNQYKETFGSKYWSRCYELPGGMFVVHWKLQGVDLEEICNHTYYDKIVISCYMIKGSYYFKGETAKEEPICMAVKKGDVVRFAGDVFHKKTGILGEDMEGICIYGNYERLSKVARNVGLPEEQIEMFYHKMAKHGDFIINVGDIKFKKIAKELNECFAENNEFLIRLKGIELLYHMVGNVDQSIVNSKKKYKREYIDEIIKLREKIEGEPGKAYSIKSLANECNLSPTYFKTIFKETFNETPHGYILRKRMEKAEELLEEEDLSIQEISEILGFSSISKFAGDFKKIYNCTPFKYRKECRK